MVRRAAGAVKRNGGRAAPRKRRLPARSPICDHTSDRENEMSEQEPGFSTLSIHAGARPDPTTGARITPIYQTTAFVFDDVDHAASLFGLQAFGNIYTRITNPTTAVLEERVAALEGAPAALGVASGHGAQALVFQALMVPGDEFIASTKLYGGSINQFNHAFKSFGWQVKWADTDEPQSFQAAVTEKTKAIFVESIANPGGVITDLDAIAAIAKKANVPLIVDNTLATPYLLRPLEHGADIIVHSATKYLGGHGNSMGGVIVDCGSFNWFGDKRYPMLSAPRPEYNGMILAETFGNFAFAIACRVLGLRDLGPAISPFNSFLILTGIETLSLRMQRHCDNALAVAQHLEKHEKVGWVSYAGLPGNRYYELARKYCPKGAGGVFTFGVKGGYEAGISLVRNLKLFSHLANIGDTRSLVIHPASTTHRQLNDAQKTAAGAGPDVVRLSIGIEDVADLIADLDQALEG
jgi:O-acetylhomoserine (thiol)-lyase